MKEDDSKLYNEERLIDKTKVTCIKWIPGSHNQFLVSHGSGQLYLYNEELPCGQTPPNYQPFKQGEGFSVFTCKTKSTRNPLYRWVIGSGAINEFAFSPCCRYLAVVGQDGYLRVFHYNTMDLVGTMKSYFGGLLCVCWSPDGKFIVTGGEDDLVTVWSFQEKRVVCRGHGHKSWVNMVAFDEYTCLVCDDENCEFVSRDVGESSSPRASIPGPAKANHVASCDSAHRDSTGVDGGSGSRGVGGVEGEGTDSTQINGSHVNSNHNSTVDKTSTPSVHYTTYRFGSVGQDTDMCLWELTEDIVRQPYKSSRLSTTLGFHAPAPHCVPRSNSLPNNTGKLHCVGNDVPHATGTSTGVGNSVITPTTKFATLSVADRRESQEKKEHKRNFSLAGRGGADRGGLLSRASHLKGLDGSVKVYGSPACPKLGDVAMLEALVCKKVAHERLTCIVFRQECIVTACQEGLVYTWARPGSVVHDGID
ncbi:hypothetical protein ACOMHN_038126 [Nucella lapillus]